MTEQSSPDREKIAEYIKGAIRYPLRDMRQLVSMVILHFSIPDEVAWRETWLTFMTLFDKEGANE